MICLVAHVEIFRLKKMYFSNIINRLKIYKNNIIQVLILHFKNNTKLDENNIKDIWFKTLYYIFITNNFIALTLSFH